MTRNNPTPEASSECALVPASAGDRSAAVALGDLRSMAESVAASGLFSMKTPAQALALMLVCQASGEHPARACTMYSIIQGRPSMTAQTMQAKFQAAGGKLRWIERTDEAAEAEFSHSAGGTLKVRWTIEQAQRIGLAGRDNWKNYPRAMLSARVVAEGVRAILPGVTLGFYAPEEISDPLPVSVTAVEDAPPHKALFAPRQSEAPLPDPTAGAAFDQAAAAGAEQVDKLAMLIGSHGAAANEVLRSKGWIQDGQTWKELPPDKLEIVLSSAARFKKSIIVKHSEMKKETSV